MSDILAERPLISASLLVEGADRSCGSFALSLNLMVVLRSLDGTKLVIETLDNLLPYAFGPADLGIDLSKYRR
ncbi:MAG: hypothetical protein COV10_03600 [Candidatus Vogelbacteria bacterium CG10_big_fil_rev_8_21_14_0_10_51_16]|uniref:Uncharacterized protein n=1 Tax=Candidatus Vogelbacteria bacterium CG10_big_fil_rev_8_21_14_0_10_51_16 TaxID=1975045 RepID=A0A2H0RF59_9BACT|nr:MAG: hypothetical protein COV10_03600 [Candidatus Vogelbacteria bacterium CG10_big_fil_rev_8_21_14_0_10_51_16]